jgi:charged multivesicular body protein 7
MATSSPPTFSRSVLALPPYATASPSRLQALYSDISRQKHSNPTSYHANIEWWRKTLQLLVSSGLQQSKSRLVLNAGRNLVEEVRLERVGKPLALGAVVVRFASVAPSSLRRMLTELFLD